MKRALLHLDDDPAMTRIAHESLANYGYDTVPLHDPDQLINSVIENGYRVVLLDIDLGVEKSGLDWLVDLKRLDGGIQVVMLTALVGHHIVLSAMRRGAYDCLFKPIDSMADVAKSLDNAFMVTERWKSRLHELNRRMQHENLAVAGTR